MNITPITLGSLEMICRELREVDQREILNLRPHDSWAILALEAYHVLAYQGRGVIAWVDGMPAGVMGFGKLRPGVWDAVSFGTNNYEKAAFLLMRAGREMARDILRETDARRLQADARADNIKAHQFIEALGGKPESTMRSYGKDGSDYVRFVWLRAAGDGALVGVHVNG